MSLKTALLFGATGLTGSCLLDLLLTDDRYDFVKVFVRQSTGRNHPKLTEVITDFQEMATIRDEIKGDHLFCCLGTTIAKAKTKESFRKVDFDLPLNICSVAHSNGIKAAIIISSLGANPKVSNFYLRTKGEMEAAIMKIGFEKLSFVRPSMLLGNRAESRPGESIGKSVMKFLNLIFAGPLKKYKAIPGLVVAKAMVEIANSENSELFYESDRLWKWS